MSTRTQGNKKAKGTIAKKTGGISPLAIGLGALALVILVAVFLFAQNGKKASSMPAEISVADALAKREAGAFILDVREQEEWDQVHIPGATLIPLGDLSERTSELPKDQEIVVVCRSGNRSASGRDLLKQAGFEKVTSMAGGMNEWDAAGYPTERGQ